MKKPNKTEQIARFVIARNKHMSAREIFDSGFQFDDGPTTASIISSLLNKMHHSSRYTVERQVRELGSGFERAVRVIAIEGASTSGEFGIELKPTERDLWRNLLSGKSISA